MTKRRLILLGLLAAAVAIGLSVWQLSREKTTDNVPEQRQPMEVNVAYLTEVTGDDAGRRFGGPFGVHCDPAGCVYVADDLDHAILVFDQDGRFMRRLGRHGTGPGEVAYLDHVITGPDGKLWVADTGNNRIQVLDLSGRPQCEVRRWGFFRALRHPRCLAWDGKGRLWVADWGNNCVRVLTSSLELVRTIGSKGDAPGYFDGPIAVMQGPNECLYVADFRNHRVQAFDDQGTFVFAIEGRGSEPARFRNPCGLAFDQRGRLFVADHGNDRIQVFTPRGDFLYAFGGPGTGPGQFNKPCGIAIDGANTLYVVDQGNRRVQVFRIE